MLGSKYRLTRPCSVLTDCGGMIQLPIGSLLVPTSNPDASGMINSACNGQAIRVFACDLEARSERMALRQPSAAVRISSALDREGTRP